MTRRQIIAGIVAAVVAAGIVGWTTIRPSHDRDWVPEQSRLPSVELDETRARIRNVRNFDHCPESGLVRSGWEDRTYDLDALDSLWFVLSPFDRDWRGPAHPFLSFGFGDTAFVAISIEARKEPGESYSVWRGLLKRYELMYVIADERDLIGLRARCWDDDVYVYPVRTGPDRARRLFVEMLERAEALRARPEFYHTLWNNCTTGIVDHANRVAARKIPGGLRTILPGYTDELAGSLGLLDAEGSVDEIRARYRVNERARRHAGRPDFSIRIRETDPT